MAKRPAPLAGVLNAIGLDADHELTALVVARQLRTPRRQTWVGGGEAVGTGRDGLWHLLHECRFLALVILWRRFANVGVLGQFLGPAQGPL